MTSISARVVRASVSPAVDRIATLELVFPRFLLAELNTHRDFSRNSASSRARSVKKTIQEVRDDPFVPLYWPSERVGMAGGGDIDDGLRPWADKTWLDARDEAVAQASKLVKLGIHKSLVNRLLEPFMWHVAVVTSTQWQNFFDQRTALLDDGTPASEPHFHELATRMRDALNAAEWHTLLPGEWHLPYITADEWNALEPDVAVQVSAARCAGVSYLRHGEDKSVDAAVKLFRRLRSAEPPHWSPLEHVATPGESGERYYNLHGWKSLRWIEEMRDGSY